MPRTCTICRHPERQEIEIALLKGEAYRTIADRTGTRKTSLLRHRREHLPAKLARAAEGKDTMEGHELLDRLDALVRETQAILHEARGSKDNELALKAIARAEGQIELQARLLGQLRDTRLSVHVAFSPEAAERVAAAFLARRSPPAIDTEARSE